VRIAFLVNWREGATSGIFAKVRAQTSAWTACGHEVGLFVTTEGAAHDDWAQLTQAVHVSLRGSGAGAKLRARESAARAAGRWGPDVVYVRHGLPHPALLRLARQVPLVVEVNGDDLVELPRVAPGQVAAAKLARGLLLRSAAGLVFVTHELQERQSFARYGRPSVVVANGIDLAAVPPLARRTEGPLAFALVGNPRTPWHGIDEVADLARTRPEWEVHLVGPAADELGTERPPNLVAHGLLGQDALMRVLSRVDVGLGTLALHRAGLQEASALKVRQYLAHGLPVVLGNRDTDFPGGAPFLLEVPNREGALASRSQEIEAFASRWRGASVPRAAIAHLDYAVKERTRLEFLARCAERGRA
jgi:hypothetical protein